MNQIRRSKDDVESGTSNLTTKEHFYLDLVMKTKGLEISYTPIILQGVTNCPLHGVKVYQTVFNL